MKPSKPRKEKSYVTKQIRKNIVIDHHDNELTCYKLAKKYNLAYNTIRKIVDDNAYGYWERDEKAELPPRKPQRIVILTDPAETILNDVIKLTLFEMKSTLQENSGCFDAKELASILSAVAPYGLQKLSSDGKGKEVPKVDLLKMFKENLNKQKNGTNSN